MSLALKESIRTIPDFPKPGILFRDITPILSDKEAFRFCIRELAGQIRERIDSVISIESRGFIFGAALAYELGAGFVPIRKEGKLPHRTFKASYELEYGASVLEVHADALRPEANVILVDDVLATGGTIEAATRLVERFNVNIKGAHFLIELSDLKGRDKLRKFPVHALVTF